MTTRASGPTGSGTRAAAAVFGGFALLAAVDACSIAVAIPLPAGGVDLRLAHLVYDAAETLGMGAVLAILVGSFVRFVRLDRRPLMGVAMGAALAVTYLVLKDYLPIFAAHLLDGRLVSVIYVVWLAGTAFALAAAPVIATQAASHRIFRFVPVPLAIVGIEAPFIDATKPPPYRSAERSNYERAWPEHWGELNLSDFL